MDRLTKSRVCLLCGTAYTARNILEKDTFCPNCFTKTRRHELRRINNQLHRAAKMGLLATLTVKQWLATLDHFGWKCAYCPTGEYEVLEHIISTTIGGGTTMLNCVPACKSCNSRKDKDIPDKLSKTCIEKVKEDLEKIAKALGVKSRDLIIDDSEFEEMQQDVEEVA